MEVRTDRKKETKQNIHNVGGKIFRIKIALICVSFSFVVDDAVVFYKNRSTFFVKNISIQFVQFFSYLTVLRSVAV